MQQNVDKEANLTMILWITAQKVKSLVASKTQIRVDYICILNLIDMF